MVSATEKAKPNSVMKKALKSVMTGWTLTRAWLAFTRWRFTPHLTVALALLVGWLLMDSLTQRDRYTDLCERIASLQAGYSDASGDWAFAGMDPLDPNSIIAGDAQVRQAEVDRWVEDGAQAALQRQDLMYADSAEGRAFRWWSQETDVILSDCTLELRRSIGWSGYDDGPEWARQ